MAQMVKHPTPGFGSGPNLLAPEIEPCLISGSLLGQSLVLPVPSSCAPLSLALK